ncbi:MAG TPA: hypothetical protein VIK78_00535 [Ruminiclostridium sp.]
MEETQSISNRLLSKIADKKIYINEKKIKYYNLDLLVRIINRLVSFSDNCEECLSFLNSLEPYIDSIEVNADKQKDKTYHVYLNSIISHLQLKHKLVTDNYYTMVCLPLGMVFGSAFSAIGSFKGMSSGGIGIGLCLGVAIGSGMDANAKKKGSVI